MPSRFLLSAASAADFPATGLPEIALVGRSNVGKSSLINALTRQKIARTSAAPGKTRLANYYLVDAGPRVGAGRNAREFYLVDLPGYGYARGGEASAQEFEELTREYFEQDDPRRKIAGVLHLIDARHPDLPQDAAAFEWLARTGLPAAIVATKVDKLTQSERVRIAKTLASRYRADVVGASAMSDEGLDAVWKTMRQWLASSPPTVQPA